MLAFPLGGGSAARKYEGFKGWGKVAGTMHRVRYSHNLQVHRRNDSVVTPPERFDVR